MAGLKSDVVFSSINVTPDFKMLKIGIKQRKYEITT